MEHVNAEAEVQQHENPDDDFHLRSGDHLDDNALIRYMGGIV